MVKVARILDALCHDDQRAVAHEVHKTYGGPLTDAERASRYRDRLRHENVTLPSRERHENITNTSQSRDGGRHETVTGERDGASRTLSSSSSTASRASRKEPPTVLPEGFVRFWNVYPKRIAKGDALKVWIQKNLEPKADQIVAGLTKTLSYVNREKGKYRKNPATWLNALGWEDELPLPPDDEDDD